MASPFGATEEATWKFLVSRMGLTAGLGHPEEPATLSDSSMLAGLFPHLLYWNHAGAYEKKKSCCCLVAKWCPTQGPHRLHYWWDFPHKNTGVGCCFFLQGIFMTQGLKLHLLHWQADFILFLPLSHVGSPLMKKKKATKKWRASSQMSFPGGSVVSRIRLGNKTTINSQTETVHLSVA